MDDLFYVLWKVYGRLHLYQRVLDRLSDRCHGLIELPPQLPGGQLKTLRGLCGNHFDHGLGLIETGSEFNATVRMGELDTLTESGSKAMGIRVFKGSQKFLSYTSDFDLATLERFLDESLELVNVTGEDEHNGLPAADELADSIQDLALHDPGVDAHTPATEGLAGELQQHPAVATVVGRGEGRGRGQQPLGMGRSRRVGHWCPSARCHRCRSCRIPRGDDGGRGRTGHRPRPRKGDGAGGVLTLKKPSTQLCRVVPKLKYHLSLGLSPSMY